jgi:hypothetical protein
MHAERGGLAFELAQDSAVGLEQLLVVGEIVGVHGDDPYYAPARRSRHFCRRYTMPLRW